MIHISERLEGDLYEIEMSLERLEAYTDDLTDENLKELSRLGNVLQKVLFNALMSSTRPGDQTP
jgi:hypothetical protein